ncbi:MAG: PD40 domain-containing protein [Anaerolineales bacterium]|nr:PD40 domain-containing protein [Anaerolineales bacterium]
MYPVITSDASTLIFRDPATLGHAGELIVMRAGQGGIECDGWLGLDRVLLAADQTHAVVHLVSPLGRLALFDLEFCREDLNEIPSTIYDENTLQHYPGPGAISPDGQSLAFGTWSEEHQSVVVVVHNFASGDDAIVGLGVTPAWSPDGQCLAYTGEDGIYIVRVDGTNERRLVEYRDPEGGEAAYTDADFHWPPLPSWSADGEWVVYHKCVLPVRPETNCHGLEDYAIFKVNVETGEEIKIVDGGLNPYWRWRGDNP